jgi:hypothetical protein
MTTEWPKHDPKKCPWQGASRQPHGTPNEETAGASTVAISTSGIIPAQDEILYELKAIRGSSFAQLIYSR